MRYQQLIVVLLLVLAASACKMEPIIENKNPKISSELYDYVVAFEREFGVDVRHNVVLGDVRRENWSGQCVRSGIFGRKTTIDREDWPHMSEASRIWTVFHELAHCSCDIGHYNASREDGAPASIMHEGGMITDKHFTSNEDVFYYMDELRGRMRAGNCQPATQDYDVGDR